MRSAIYDAVLEHERDRPARNAFRYRTYQLLLDLDELDALARTIPELSVNRRNVVEVRSADHLGDPARPIRENACAILRAHGVEPPVGRIELLTNARTFGYVFNPVSFYFFRDAGDELAYVLAEVHNTFGERYPYLLGPPAARDADGRLLFTAEKRFHVSPFMGLEGTYRFTLDEPAARLCVRIDEEREGTRFFRAVLTGTGEPLTAPALRRALVRYPLSTAQTMARIHWQAVKLAAKRVPFHKKPGFDPERGSIPR